MAPSIESQVGVAVSHSGRAIPINGNLVMTVWLLDLLATEVSQESARDVH